MSAPDPVDVRLAELRDATAAVRPSANFTDRVMVAAQAIASAGLAISRPMKLAGMVVNGVASVVTPTTPTTIGPFSTMNEPSTLSHGGRLPVSASRTLAIRNGNAASAARARSAPRASSPGLLTVTAGPGGPKSNSWLPIAAAS